MTQGGAVTGTNGASPVQVTLSAPLAGNSPLPGLHPATPGTWKKTGSTLTFTPATPFWPGSRVRLPGRRRLGLRSAAGGVLAKTMTSGPPRAGPACGSSRCWRSWATCR